MEDIEIEFSKELQARQIEVTGSCQLVLQISVDGVIRTSETMAGGHGGVSGVL